MANLKSLQKSAKIGTIMADDSMLKAENQRYVDTGSYALNKIISGKLTGGIPIGRAVTFNGVSGVGKSFFTATCMRNFQTQCDGKIVLFESENAMDEGFYTRLGVDTGQILWTPTESVDELQDQMIKFLNTIKGFIDAEIEENKSNKKWNILTNSEHYGKYLFVVDSLGNLMSAKEKKDSEIGKVAGDMGQKAKGLRLLGRTIIPLLRKTGITLISTNHVYTDASGYVPKKVAAGGGGPEYISHVIIFFTKGKLKKDKDIVGNLITASTEKNRLTRPFQSVKVDLNYKTGLNKLSGLQDMLLDAGIIKASGSRYIINVGGEEKSLYWKDIEPNIESYGWIKELDKYYENEGYFDATKISMIDENVTEDLVYEFDSMELSIGLTENEYNTMSIKSIKDYIVKNKNMKDQIKAWELQGKKRKGILDSL